MPSFPKAALFFAVLAAALSVLIFLRPVEPAGAQEGQMPPMPVTVMVAEEKPVQIWKEFPARLTAVDSVAIRPQASGAIQEIRFEDGQFVNRGDVLFVIDPRPYEAAVAQAKADLQSAKNQRDLALKEFKRAEELIDTGAIPKRLYDERFNNNQMAKSAVAGAEARLKSASLNLEYAHIKAPIAGRVSRAEITAGNLVDAGPNAPVLTTIVSSDGVYADFDVDEGTYLNVLRTGAKDREAEKKIPVRLVLKGDSESSYEGMIHSFDNRIDTASGTIRARVLFDNWDGMLLPGMFVRVRIAAAEGGKAITVPESAIGTDQDRKFVYIADENNAVAYREITPGESVNGSRVVLKGLQAGDKIITEGIIKLRPGMPVAVQEQK